MSGWNDLLGPVTDTDGVQARLRISREAVATMAAERLLLRVVSSDGVDLYPLWQVQDGRIRPGLSAVLALFPEAVVDGWTLAAWLRTPDPELGECALDALTRGDEARVLAAARNAARALAT